jgi:hypothetical protein
MAAQMIPNENQTQKFLRGKFNKGAAAEANAPGNDSIQKLKIMKKNNNE